MSHLVLHAITPLHVGIGQGVHGVSLPVARQKPRGFPYVPGSTIKGCLRSQLEANEQTNAIFGSPHGEEESAGGLMFGDAQLVAMPVRSKTLTFAWVTCDTLLTLAGRALDVSFEVTANGTEIVLENDLKVKARNCQALEAWIASSTGHALSFVDKRVFVVTDDDFSILQEFCTQIDLRNRIDLDTGVVRDKALWSEESLAPETLLVTPLSVRLGMNASLSGLTTNATLTLGGKNTIGRGVCRLIWEGI